ncbi:chemotaxis protein CheW [Consotaella salsifontis]|uniref:Chemotaxis protein CheW n=1 Tax=Consotaella salsifontis TaxID=1365950 RepID=A0A1T4STQ4_9HYPH|nr:chemotaxis protein CheW [Consotaella salsifontis]SKA31536.1 CheW protein [Consotaella salsifontis]
MSEITAQDTTLGSVSAKMCEGGCEFVTFFIKAETFAVPLRQVKEIIRMPALMNLPLAPRSLQGITNLRGAVLPVLNLRRAFGIEDVGSDDATRVVVLDIGRPVGIVVDRMSAVETVDPTLIEGTERIRSQVDSELIKGVIRQRPAGAGEAQMTMILDIEEVVARECAAPTTTQANRAPDQALMETAAAARETASEDVRQFVSFVVDRQEYALPIEDVQEIVHVPATIAAVPNAPAAVVGMVTLRDRLLPILSLRRLLGLSEKPVSEEDRVIVVSPADTGHTTTVGLVTDAVREVLRIGSSVIDAMPPMLVRGETLNEIVSVCRLDGGKRLVSILDATAVVDKRDVREVVANHTKTPEQADEAMERNLARATADEEQVVIFKLADEEFGVAIDAVQEIVRLPERLIRVPKAPSFIEGIINLRGTIVPLVDQRRRFGLAPMERNERQRVVVFTMKGVRSAFIVDSVVEVRRIPRSLINDAPEMSEAQSKLIRRVANLAEQRRMIQLLDVDQLLDTRESRLLQTAVDGEQAAA